MNKPTLENIKNLAFLSNESYKTAVDTVQKGKEKEQMSFKQPLINPATNSSFEVYNQADNDSTGFSATVFKDTSTGEYVIAFRGTEIPNEFSISKIAESGLDAKAEAGELKSLKEHGIKSINLEFSTDNTALDKDNKQILVGSFAINDSDNALASDIDFSVNTIEREMAESAGLVKGTGFVGDFKPNLSKEIGEFYDKYKGLESKAEQIAATDELVALWAKTAKQYKELDNPIQKVKINISSVANGTSSYGIDEAIKRANNNEITINDEIYFNNVLEEENQDIFLDLSKYVGDKVVKIIKLYYIISFGEM
ncbi:hypothetical protein [uncultured Campylobacter sp.]|uniref:hypothetical protein n=1 Tax=uncultured Campylobacter sp. TaxID=218934 RepID=UPI00260D02D7|nr:hypothetical protein [uncultured Campylobacter sp.]